MTYYNAYNIEKRQADLLLCLEYLKEPGRPTTVNRIKEDPSRSIIGWGWGWDWVLTLGIQSISIYIGEPTIEQCVLTIEQCVLRDNNGWGV